MPPCEVIKNNILKTLVSELKKKKKKWLKAFSETTASRKNFFFMFVMRESLTQQYTDNTALTFNLQRIYTAARGSIPCHPIMFAVCQHDPPFLTPS